MAVETEGRLTRGATVVDLHGRLGEPPNARVAVELDVERFWDLVIGALRGAVIAVVGSVNLDVVVAVPRLPGPGETVVGGDRRELPGGKGANQAVAAARLGSAVAFVGRVGADVAGRRLRADLLAEGVDVATARGADAPSGMALIGVEEGGENAIVVCRGPTGASAPRTSRPRASCSRARAWCCSARDPGRGAWRPPRPRRADASSSTRPPRASSRRPPPTSSSPNRGELARLAGPGAPAGAAARLGLPAVVVTSAPTGRSGRRRRARRAGGRAGGPRVDTTGAGDAFCGALADALDRGAELVEAARRAVVAAALSVTGEGARGGLPSRAEVERTLR